MENECLMKCAVCGKEELFSAYTEKLMNFNIWYYGWRVQGRKYRMLCPHHASLWAIRQKKKAEKLRSTT